VHWHSFVNNEWQWWCVGVMLTTASCTCCCVKPLRFLTLPVFLNLYAGYSLWTHKLQASVSHIHSSHYHSTFLSVWVYLSSAPLQHSFLICSHHYSEFPCCSPCHLECASITAQLIISHGQFRAGTTANITATVDDMTLSSLTSLTTMTTIK